MNWVNELKLDVQSKVMLSYAGTISVVMEMNENELRLIQPITTLLRSQKYPQACGCCSNVVQKHNDEIRQKIVNICLNAGKQARIYRNGLILWIVEFDLDSSNPRQYDVPPKDVGDFSFASIYQPDEVVDFTEAKKIYQDQNPLLYWLSDFEVFTFDNFCNCLVPFAVIENACCASKTLLKCTFGPCMWCANMSRLKRMDELVAKTNGGLSYKNDCGKISHVRMKSAVPCVFPVEAFMTHVGMPLEGNVIVR